MSKITIEQVEKLQERANVSYEEAKEALETTDGDILEALIRLEKEGKTAKAGAGAYRTDGRPGEDSYEGQSSNNGYASGNGNTQNAGNQNSQSGPRMDYSQGQYKETDFSKQAKSVWRSFLDLLHKGNINHFVIRKNGQETMRMPVNVLIILLIIFNAAALIALVILLFFGFRYSFEGPSMDNRTINDVMDSVSDTADDIKENVKNAADDKNNN